MSDIENIEMCLDDEVIGQVAKLLQLAILTGTDIIDNLRMLRVTFNDETGTLVLTDEYRATSESNIEKLMKVAVGPEELGDN
jgi:hypothetical protein